MLSQTSVVMDKHRTQFVIISILQTTMHQRAVILFGILGNYRTFSFTFGIFFQRFWENNTQTTQNRENISHFYWEWCLYKAGQIKSLKRHHGNLSSTVGLNPVFCIADQVRYYIGLKVVLLFPTIPTFLSSSYFLPTFS